MRRNKTIGDSLASRSILIVFIATLIQCPETFDFITELITTADAIVSLEFHPSLSLFTFGSGKSVYVYSLDTGTPVQTTAISLVDPDIELDEIPVKLIGVSGSDLFIGVLKSTMIFSYTSDGSSFVALSFTDRGVSASIDISQDDKLIFAASNDELLLLKITKIFKLTYLNDNNEDLTLSPYLYQIELAYTIDLCVLQSKEKHALILDTRRLRISSNVDGLLLNEANLGGVDASQLRYSTQLNLLFLANKNSSPDIQIFNDVAEKVGSFSYQGESAWSVALFRSLNYFVVGGNLKTLYFNRYVQGAIQTIYTETGSVSTDGVEHISIDQLDTYVAVGLTSGNVALFKKNCGDSSCLECLQTEVIYNGSCQGCSLAEVRLLYPNLCLDYTSGSNNTDTQTITASGTGASSLSGSISASSSGTAIISTTGTLATGSIATGTLATGSIATGTLASGTLATGTLATGTLASGTLATGTLATGTLATGTLASGSLPTGTLASGSLPTGTLASGSLPTGSIASGTLASGTIASGTIASGTIASGTIATGTHTSSSPLFPSYLAWKLALSPPLPPSGAYPSLRERTSPTSSIYLETPISVRKLAMAVDFSEKVQIFFQKKKKKIFDFFDFLYCIEILVEEENEVGEWRVEVGPGLGGGQGTESWQLQVGVQQVNGNTRSSTTQLEEGGAVQGVMESGAVKAGVAVVVGFGAVGGLGSGLFCMNFGAGFIKLFQIIELFGIFYLIPVEFGGIITSFLGFVSNISDLISLPPEFIFDFDQSSNMRNSYKFTYNNISNNILNSYSLISLGSILAIMLYFLSSVICSKCIINKKIKGFLQKFESFMINFSIVELSLYCSFSQIIIYKHNYSSDWKILLSKTISLIILSRIAFLLSKEISIMISPYREREGKDAIYDEQNQEEFIKVRYQKSSAVRLIKPLFKVKMVLFGVIISTTQYLGKSTLVLLTIIQVSYMFYIIVLVTNGKTFKNLMVLINSILLEIVISMFLIIVFVQSVWKAAVMSVSSELQYIVVGSSTLCIVSEMLLILGDSLMRMKGIFKNRESLMKVNLEPTQPRSTRKFKSFFPRNPEFSAGRLKKNNISGAVLGVRLSKFSKDLSVEKDLMQIKTEEKGDANEINRSEVIII